MPIKIFGQPDPLVEIDELLNVQVAIDVLHHEIHEGHAFVVSHLFEQVASAASVDILIKTAGQPLPHVVFGISVGADSRVRFYNAPALSAWGTELRVFNKRRDRPDQSNTRWFHTPGIVAGGLGTELWAGFIGGGSRNFAVGGEQSDRDEWILALNMHYLMRVTNTSQDAADIALQATYYEHMTP